MPDTTFFFYDLETSGLDPRCHRIMQFAGQRTDLALNPIGEPVNVLVKLTDEILPDPTSILITGITPQATIREGITEAELLHLLARDVFTRGTIVTGFNNVRFDDIYLRYLHYRNFYDPYEWAYADGRSRWDLLDVMRFARALRPDGLTWPVDETGRPVNKLALLAAANHLEHLKAHDALSDVHALIAIARHLKQAQPKLFDYLLRLRSKHEVAKIVSLSQPQAFIYTSGRYGPDHHFTTLAYPIGQGRNNNLLVYDLRQDPAHYTGLTPEQLAANRFPSAEDRAQPSFLPFPAKELTPGNCPAVAPLTTLDESSQDRIHLSRATALRHLESLKASDLPQRLLQAFKLHPGFEPPTDVDARLYDGFLNGSDKLQMQRVRTANPQELTNLQPHFADQRLPELFLRYKARNYFHTLSDAERTRWETYRANRLQADWPTFATSFDTLAQTATPAEQALLADLKLWAESLTPEA